MANLASHVGRTRNAVTQLIDAYQNVQGCVQEYVALGGSAAVHSFFVTVDPATKAETPRDDIDITQQQYVDAIASLAAVQALLDTGHKTNLYRVRG